MESLYCDEVLTLPTEDDRLSPDLGYNSHFPQTNSDYISVMPKVSKAHVDPILLEDSRVFRNMMVTEDSYRSDHNYFENIQEEIKPHMRKLVTDWMLEVCCDQSCHVDVFLIACNLMDRFLSQVNISKRQFQLVAAASMFIASKLVEPVAIAGTSLVKYTDNTYQLSELLDMELVILSRLKWDLCAVTPYAFLNHLLKFVMEESSSSSYLEKKLMNDIKNQAENLIILCATEFRFSIYPPSMLSSAALAHSALELEKNLDLEFNVNELISRLQLLTRVENDCLNDCIYQIERTKNKNNSSSSSPSPSYQHTSAAVNTSQKNIEPSKDSHETKDSDTESDAPESPEKSSTPTDVYDVVLE